MIDSFDIVVIGGGIHGAGVAQAAAAAGYSVKVLEQYPQLAMGTSSRSSKLVHGGLRYLETAQFSLVRECLNERDTLLFNAPKLVQLKPFYIPLYHTSQRGPGSVRIGLSLYALLGGMRKSTRFRILKPRRWDQLDGLRSEGLRVVFEYRDGQTDDAALTRAVMQSAVNLGAELLLNAITYRIELSENGSTVHYRHSGGNNACHARVTVNATGPWSNKVLQCVTPPQSPAPCDLVQGTHIVVPGKQQTGIFYVEAPQDRRAVFIMPWKGNTLVGTTERSYADAPDEVTPSEGEIEYLLETLNYYFPFCNYTYGDILEAFAGIRVLPKGNSKTSSRPRETTLITDRTFRPRLISILGGKLTAYRATAEKVLNNIATNLPSRTVIADTRTLLLMPVDVQGQRKIVLNDRSKY